MKRPAAAMSVMKRPAAAPPKKSTPVLELPVVSARPDWYNEADDKARLQNYLVTAAKLVNEEDTSADPPLRDPAKLTKEEFKEALFDSFANPIYGTGRPRSRTVELDVYFGVVEGPVDSSHHHAGVSFYKQEHIFLPFKKAMRDRHGIATHWSTSHTKRWSIIRYLHKTTDHKKVVDKGPLVWTRDGRELNLASECEEPFIAQAWNCQRERRVSEPFDPKKFKNKEPFTKLDFSALVLAKRLATPNAVLTHVMEKGTHAMKLWVHTRQCRLKQFIREAYDLEAAKGKAELEKETEWELVERLAKDATCKCDGLGCIWWGLADEFFTNNKGIDKERLAACIRKVIMFGPSKDAPVPLITGKRNCGKSTVADPILNVFGKENVLGKPKLGAPNGALADLAKDHIRFIYFDDYRPVEYAAMPKENPTVPVTDFLAMFQGQSFNPQVSQSFNDGHPHVTWHKGALMTAKEKGLWNELGNVTAVEITHMKARVEIFRATHVVGTSPEEFQSSPACPNPWCRWVVVDSIVYAARQGPRSLGRLGKPLALPKLPEDRASGSNGLSGGMKEKIAANRQRAQELKKRKVELSTNAQHDDEAANGFDFDADE